MLVLTNDCDCSNIRILRLPITGYTNIPFKWSKCCLMRMIAVAVQRNIDSNLILPYSKTELPHFLSLALLSTQKQQQQPITWIKLSFHKHIHSHSHPSCVNLTQIYWWNNVKKWLSDSWFETPNNKQHQLTLKTSPYTIFIILILI